MGKAGELLDYKKHEIIFNEGSYESCMYNIVDGSVEIFSKYGTPQEKSLTILKAGEYFGEMGLVEGYPRSATAVALTNVKVLKITANEFGSYFQENPSKVLSIMEHMSHRLRDLTKDYMEACGTITEYIKAEESKEEKSPALLDKMRKFMRIFESGGGM